MADLWFRSDRRELNEALGNIGELNRSVRDMLKERGFTDVVHTAAEVAGVRDGCRVAVTYLHNAGRDFWRVVMCVSDSGPEKTRGMVDEVVKAIDRMTFL